MLKFHGPRVFGSVTVGERGQIVIPAGVRKSYRIKAGDRLIVIVKSGGPIGLIPAEHLNGLLSHMTEMVARIKKEKIDIK